jgi:hypothetical protein
MAGFPPVLGRPNTDRIEIDAPCLAWVLGCGCFLFSLLGKDSVLKDNQRLW